MINFEIIISVNFQFIDIKFEKQVFEDFMATI